jgi:hypothetical protein
MGIVKIHNETAIILNLKNLSESFSQLRNLLLGNTAIFYTTNSQTFWCGELFAVSKNIENSKVLLFIWAIIIHICCIKEL